MLKNTRALLPKLLSFIFFGLFLDRIFEGWHGLANFHWSMPILIFMLFIALHDIAGKNSLPAGSGSIIRVCFLLLAIHCAFFIYIAFSGGVYFLRTFHGNDVLTALMKIWPYALIPICVILGITFCQRSKGLYKVVLIYVVASLFAHVWKTISTTGGSPIYFHGAYSIGFLSQIILVYCLFLIFSRKVKGSLRIVTVLVTIFCFLLPFYGAVRGATAVTVVITVFSILAYMRTSKKISSTLLIIFLIGIVLFQIASPIIDRFEEENKYGYSSFIDVVTEGMSLEGETAKGRLIWWTDAFNVFLHSPIWGTLFTYSFSPGFGRSVWPAYKLHSYYVTAMVQGGILLLLPMLYIIIKSLKVGIQRTFRGNSFVIVPVCWLYAVIMIYFSNTHAFLTTTSVALALILGLSIGLIFKNSEIS